MNGVYWTIEWVPHDSEMLVDRTGFLTVATTDPETKTVYLSKNLQGPFLIKVLLHELGHCVMISYDLIDYIHDYVYPDRWIDAEEWVCNFIADYGFQIFKAAYQIIGYDALLYLPKELEKLIKGK